MTFDEARFYLAAMIDGEGYVPACATSHRYRSIRIANTDPDLIAAMQECCDVLGLHYLTIPIKAQKSEWSDSWAVDISSRDSLISVRDYVPIRCKSKVERLNALIDSYQRIPLSMDDVVEPYARGESLKDIAARLGCSKYKVTRALRRYGVEIRARGGSR